MSMRRALRRLQRIAADAPPPQRRELNEEDFLAIFERLGEDGYFDAEPDFPVALASFRATLERAAGQKDPPFEPPPHFMAGEPIDERRRRWRGQQRFLEVNAGFRWLAEIHRRVSNGVPPVTEREFQELAAWFNGQTKRLYRLASPAYSLDLDNGERVCISSLRYDLGNGPRQLGAGQAAEQVRRLRRLYREESVAMEAGR